MRVVDLAAELGLSLAETGNLCELFDIEVGEDSSVAPGDVALLRGLKSGTLDPEDVLAQPDDQPLEDSAPGPFISPVTHDAEGDLDAAVITDADADLRPIGETLGAEEAAAAEKANGLLGRSRRRGPTVVAADQVRSSGPVKADIDLFVPKWVKYFFAASLIGLAFIAWRTLGPERAGDSGPFDAAPELAIGDCFNADDDGLWLASIEVVSCAGAHQAEATVTVALPILENDYPALADLRESARVTCARSMFGQVADLSDFSIGTSVPTRAEWEAGETNVLCSIVSRDGSPLTGRAG